MAIDPQHYIRQTGIIDPQKLTDPIACIGCGGIGSWVSLVLLKLGVDDLTVFDGDVIEEHNIGSQLYHKYNVGEEKPIALVHNMRDLLKHEQYFRGAGFWTKETNMDEYGIVIGAVDNMKVRRELFDSLKGKEKWFVDGRMAGNQINIYTTKMTDELGMGVWEENWFPDEEADPTLCSERAVAYNCSIVAGLIGDIVAQIANGEIPPHEVILDLKNFSLLSYTRKPKEEHV